MDCKIKFRKEAEKEAFDIAKSNGKIGSAKTKGLLVFYPVNKEGKVTKGKSAGEIAKRKVKEINAHFQSARFGASVTLNNGFNDGVGIDIKISEAYLDYLVAQNEKAIDMTLSREIQIEDAKRAGIEYDNRYLFDENLPGNQPPSNTNSPLTQKGMEFGEYYNRRLKAKNFIEQRAKVLKEMKGSQSLQKKREIKFFNDLKDKEENLLKRISGDIASLNTGSYVLDNFFTYFNSDISTINDMLNQNPSLENLMAAEEYMKTLRWVFSADILDSPFFAYGIDKLEGSTLQKFNTALNSFKKLDNKYVQKTNSMAMKVFKEADENATDLSEKEEVQKLIDLVHNSEISILEEYFLPLDGDGSKEDTIRALVRKIFDDSISKQEISYLQDRILNHKESLERELPVKKRSGFGLLSTTFDYSILKKTAKDGASRLISKYSSVWNGVLKNYNYKINSINLKLSKPNKTRTDYITIDKIRKSLFRELKNNGAAFIAIESLPEMQDSDMLESFERIETLFAIPKDNLRGRLEDTKKAEEYKERVIKQLQGKHGTRLVAEREYNNLIAEQKDKMLDLEIDLEKELNTALEKEAKNVYSELSIEKKQELANSYLSKSPFFLSKNLKEKGNSTITIPQYDQSTLEVSHSLEYTTFIPSKDNHFDKDFSDNIESNPVILEAWENFSSALKYINSNRKYMDNNKNRDTLDYIDSLIDTAKEHNLEIMANASAIKRALRPTKKFLYDASSAITEALGLRAHLTGTTQSLRTVLTSVDERIREIAQGSYSLLTANEIKLMSKYKNGILSDKAFEILQEQLGVTSNRIDPNTTLKRHIQDIIRERVYKSQDSNMTKDLIAQLGIVQEFKAKKEVETKLKFLRGLIQKIKVGSSITEKSNVAELVENFINTHLYGHSRRPTDKLKLYKSYTGEDKMYIEATRKAIEDLEEVLEMTQNESARRKIEADIKSLQKNIDNKGHLVTGQSVIEAMFVKTAIYAGLGYNFTSQIINNAIGNFAGRQNDGLLYSRGNYPKAHSYMRTWKRAHIKGMGFRGKKAIENRKLTLTFLDGLALYQNSANDIQNIVNEKKFDSKQRWISPLKAVSITEREIQRPQILAMLGDMKITDSQGNIQPIFDVNNHNNPHPAFELINGNLKLKTDKDAQGKSIPGTGFDTQENRDTWINKVSKEYLESFSESGTVPKKIAVMNGDYRDTSTIKFKRHLLGAMAMVFKTWYSAYILRRYGNAYGVYTNMADNHSIRVYTNLAMKGALAGALLGTATAFSPIIGAGIGISVVMFNKAQMKTRIEVLITKIKKMNRTLEEDVQKDIAKIALLSDKLAEISLLSGFRLGVLSEVVKSTVGTVAGTGLKLAQSTVQTLTPGGKAILTNEMIDKALWMSKKKGETDEEYEKNLNRAHFLLVELSTTLKMLGMKSLALVFLSDFGDDEEDEFGSETNFIKRIWNHPKMAAYYAVTNLATRFSQDINLDVDLVSNIGLINPDIFKTLKENLTAVGKTMIGDTKVKGGKNEGRYRMAVEFNKYVPMGIREITTGNVPSLGFKGLTEEKKYNENWMSERRDSDEEHFDNIKKKTRAKEKQIFLEDKIEEHIKKFKKEPEKEDIETYEKKALKYINATYPPLTNYFKEDGSVKTGFENKLVKYDTDRVDEIIENRKKKKE